MGKGNLFAGIPEVLAEERFDPLARGEGVRIERIVSRGQRSPEGFWYDQAEDEWVVVVRGRARLEIEGQEDLELGPGDHLLIPAHQRHRVAWTDPDQPTVWLAVHFAARGGG